LLQQLVVQEDLIAEACLHIAARAPQRTEIHVF
jgi:hypothetical protein